MTLHFFKDVANDAESTQKIYLYVIFACLKRLPGSRLLISSLPGPASRKHAESLGKPRDVNKCLEALPG